MKQILRAIAALAYLPGVAMVATALADYLEVK